MKIMMATAAVVLVAVFCLSAISVAAGVEELSENHESSATTSE